MQIQLTVQNVTGKPRTVTYDVNGVERSRSALVGVPLTVVASTALEGVRPSAVRRNAGDDLEATNGALSQDQKGVTQVQWATILAPPQMQSSTKLTLSLDAHDFKVPDIDLSLEPGLISDTSVGALIDDAFNPSGSSQLRLEQRTIELIGRVNLVLARAGKTVDRVRSTLNDSADTLGHKTVTDLQSSASSINASLKGLDSSVNSLGQDLTASLHGTRSTTLEQLRQMVRAVDQMLGDTSAKAPASTLSGNGCGVTVEGAKKAGSVYGDLLQVVSQLDGYSRATGSCKDALRSSILRTVGPEDSDVQSCAGSTSVTCSLLAAETSFMAIAAKLVADGDAAVAALKLETADNAVAAAHELAAATLSVHAAATALGQAEPLSGDLDVDPLRQALRQTSSAAADVRRALDSVHQQAAEGQERETVLGGLNADLGAEGLLDAGLRRPVRHRGRRAAVLRRLHRLPGRRRQRRAAARRPGRAAADGPADHRADEGLVRPGGRHRHG